MKRIIFASLLVALAAAPSLGQARTGAGDLKAALLQMEKGAWQAWEKKDRAFFEKFLADPSINISPTGVDERAAILSGITSGTCQVRSWSIDESTAKVYMIDKDAAILTYKATQDATCGGQAAPANVWASSVFVKRGKTWVAVHHQETAAM